jgi:hypothetical protein
MRRVFCVIFFVIFLIVPIYCQDTDDDAEKKEAEKKYAINSDKITDEIAKATVFAVPSSPAFTLLDVNPSKVNRPGFLRDFRLDWVIKENNLAPDIAIELQPIWLIFFGKVNHSKYKSMKWLPKTLSTLSFSIGTVTKDDIHSLAYSIKVSLYRGADPIDDEDYINEIKPVMNEAEEKLISKRAALKKELEYNDKLTDEKKVEYEERIKELEKKVAFIAELENKKVQLLKEKYDNEHWNAAVLDVGYGRIYNYTGDSLDKLKFESKGSGLWINGGLGIKKRWFLSGLFKYIKLEDDNQYFGGVNLRYGSAKANFFIEGVYEDTGVEDKITIAYGGNYKINSNVMLEFGIRTEYDKDFKFSDLKPVVKLNWIM